MATTDTSPMVVPSPSATSDTANHPLQTAATSISPGEWLPEPTLTPALGDPIVDDCAQDASQDYYFLDLQTAYHLRDMRVGRNYSLTRLELTGFYYLNGDTFPVSSSEFPLLSASFGGRSMEMNRWVPRANGLCALFTFIIQSGLGTAETSVHGPLLLAHSDTSGNTPSILVSGVEVDLVLQPLPEAPPAPTDESTPPINSSIGQDSNQTAAPASGNVPVSSSSSSSSPKASVIAPAIVVPVVVVLAALAAFFLWRRRRRARLAPSAAFRADHADAVEAMERQGATVGLGGTGTPQMSTAGVSMPAQSSSYFPLDEKRPLNT
jgi:MYXO-CTERM domain-containing protein